MASPPPYSPAGSPPYPSHAQLPSKKRPSGAADLAVQPPKIKRRKPSTMSITSATSAHPLRQTSFPPDESQSQVFSPTYQRSPSVDNMSLVSGSQVSTAPAKKKRGRKSKAERASEAAAEAAARADGASSIVDGRAGTAMSTASGNKGNRDDGGGDRDGDGDGAFEVPENMASKAADRSQEQIKEEERLRALLTQKMDGMQFSRYEVWHRATLKIGDVKRHINSVTSQSCPVNVQQMMQVVCKMYLGDLVEDARRVQEEWIEKGEKQTDLPAEQDNTDEVTEEQRYRRHAPLRPDHLREAYRRRKATADSGGAMGSLMVWSQQSHNGVERFAPRAGGRRIFR
ncbi:hTAFII28-like protein conserved region-domain-containing protein [Microdochium bolleyi]|uniref:HTAFII28-like protein conserved region-domain-containing protein n=1 Tax=Microdochium bolleyi TaxID=196109 RepID=A0A136J8W4_9PEZI|nr:hTAFII28-like protein conserved region-domain-containing protein [Microdochium bolleyi]